MNEQSSPPKLKRPIQIEKPIVGLPARKVAKTKQTLNIKKITKKHCSVCKVVFQSKEDVVAKKKFGIVKNTCIGCSHEDCDYWVHVRCVDESVKTKKDIHKLDFTCPTHKVADSAI